MVIYALKIKATNGKQIYKCLSLQLIALLTAEPISLLIAIMNS